MEDQSNIYNLSPNDPMPLYAQLERAIRHAIAIEKLRVGDQLPTVRQLAVDLRINANTVAKVYGELERTGLLETRRGVGTFVRRSGEHNGPLAERSARLDELVDRFIAESAVLGFTAEEAANRLALRIRKKGSNDG